MASNDDIELMQHADGELDERAAAGVRARLDGDPEAKARAEALGEIRELVRGHLELAADAVPERRWDQMWKAIEQSTRGATEGAVERAADRASDRAPARGATEHGEGAGLWVKISAWFDRYRGHVITGAVSAGAVAALALVLRPAGPDDNGLAGRAGQPIEVQPASLRAAPVIEALDTPGGTATVLNLEDEDGHTAVIWVTPADTVEGI